VQRLFSSLNPRESLVFAIMIEERNHHVYSRLGDLFRKHCSNEPELQSLFYDLARKEKQHGTLLQEHHDARFGPMELSISEDAILESIEAPHLNLGDILAAAETGDAAAALRMSLEMAIATENGAVAFYSELVKRTTDSELKSLYEQLLVFEQDHTDGLREIRV